MLLNDIGRVPATTLRKINQHLESNYGFAITESVQDQDLVAIMETIQEEITDLKIKGDDAKSSPEISKRLLVLEGIKSLREFAMMQFQSPKLDTVVRGMTQFVIDTFHHSGTSMEDFDEAVKDAMKVYRSSKYRFPDEFVEGKVREAALAQLNSTQSDPIAEEEIIAEISNQTASNYMKGAMHDTISGKKDRNPGMKKAVSQLAGNNKPLLPPQPLPKNETKQTPMVRNSAGQMVADPKGIPMKENTNRIKQLRALLETEVSQAEVMMAAKGFAQELQEMVEKIGRLQNEDLPPVTDQMRETYGQDSASAFQTQIYSALQGVMDSLYTAKGQVDDAVSNMAATGQVSAAVDMDKDLAGDGMDPMAGGDEIGMDSELDLDNIGDELAGDEFGGADGEEPLGRSMKAESVQLKRKIAEMKRIVEKARRLKEASK